MQIKLDNVGVKYGDKQILNGIFATFDEGVNVVMGKSGQGKTTLLYAIAKLLPFSGEITSTPVSFLFQDERLVENLSAVKNVEAVLDTKDKTRRQKALDALSQVELVDKANDKVSQLSGGERQRVALARAFVAGRQVLLLDEPFDALDHGVKKKVIALFNKLCDSSHTVVFVTHDVECALAVADRVYLLDDGISLVANVTTPKDERNLYSSEMLSLKKHIEELTD